MNTKITTLKKAINAMSELMKFEDNLKSLTGLDCVETVPCNTSGILFDIITDTLLTEWGADLVVGFLFDPFGEYNEERPYSIIETNEDDKDNTIQITNVDELCDYLDKKGGFKE